MMEHCSTNVLQHFKLMEVCCRDLEKRYRNFLQFLRDRDLEEEWKNFSVAPVTTTTSSRGNFNSSTKPILFLPDIKKTAVITDSKHVNTPPIASFHRTMSGNASSHPQWLSSTLSSTAPIPAKKKLFLPRTSTASALAAVTSHSSATTTAAAAAASHASAVPSSSSLGSAGWSEKKKPTPVNQPNNGDPDHGLMDEKKKRRLPFKIFVGALAPETTSKMLRSYFEENYGSVCECHVYRDKFGKSRRFAFVIFEQASVVDLVLEQRVHRFGNQNMDCRGVDPEENFFEIGKERELFTKAPTSMIKTMISKMTFKPEQKDGNKKKWINPAEVAIDMLRSSPERKLSIGTMGGLLSSKYKICWWSEFADRYNGSFGAYLDQHKRLFRVERSMVTLVATDPIDPSWIEKAGHPSSSNPSSNQVWTTPKHGKKSCIHPSPQPSIVSETSFEVLNSLSEIDNSDNLDETTAAVDDTAAKNSSSIRGTDAATTNHTESVETVESIDSVMDDETVTINKNNTASAESVAGDTVLL